MNTAAWQPSRSLTLLMVPFLLATGCATNPRPVAKSSPPPVIIGDFVDDYGGHFTITATDWFQRPRNHFTVVAWHTADQYLIARNVMTDPHAVPRWTRIDWLLLPDQGAYQWGFCFSAWDAPSRAAAEAAHLVDRAHPRTGCNGYPFSRMRRAGAFVDGKQVGG